MKRMLVTAAAAVAVALYASASLAGIEEAKKWVDDEFQPSTLSKAEQIGRASCRERV